MNWYKKAQIEEIDEDLLSALQETLTEEKDRNRIIRNHPDGRVSEHDEEGNVIWQKFYNGREERYDGKGNVIWKKHLGREYFYKLNDKGDILWVKEEPDGKIWEYKYDEKGNKVWAKYPDGSVETYKWDADGKEIFE